METSAPAGRMTKRFVAGQSLNDALSTCQRLNSDGYLVSLDYLGENVHTPDEARVCRDAYLESLREIAARGLKATVSIKLTQFGLDFSEQTCRENVEPLVALAKQVGSRVEMDMESSGYVDRTLNTVEHFHQRYGSVRAVIQAYLFRSAMDIARLNGLRLPVRLCKGAYNEPPSVAFARKSDVDANYVKLMKTLLLEGAYPAIASHDELILREAMATVRGRKLGVEAFEFQMLYGIRRDLQKELTDAGYRLRLYVPYGDAWYPYFMRRLAERPANVLFIGRNLLRN